MAKVIVILAEGFEEIEGVSMIDILRRGGVEVSVAHLGERLVRGANGIVVEAEMAIESLQSDDYDMIALPGGWGGTNHLAEDERVQSLLKGFKSSGRYVAAMCAAPYALHVAGVLGDHYTCYPSVEEKIGTKGYTDTQKVVIDGKVITSRGPGTALCFGLAIVKALMGEESYNTVKKGTLSDFC